MAQKNLLNMVQGTLEKASVLSMEKGSPVVSAMEFKEIQGNAYSFNVVDTLLPTDHRELGQDVLANEMQATKVTRELLILTNSSKVDRALSVFSDIVDIQAESQHLAMVSNGKTLERKVLAELNNYLTRGEAGKLYTGVLSVDLIDDMLDFVAGATMIFVNNQGQRALKKLLKSEGQQLESVESFGRRVISFGNVPVHVSQDLKDNEMLVVKFSEEGVHGITNGSLRVYNKEVGVFNVTDTELLYNVVCKTKNSFAKAEFTKK